MGKFAVYLMGSIQASWESGNPPNFRSQRTKALLGYLTAEKRSISRDALALLLWPDELLSKGKTNLRKELHNLNNILPGCWQANDKTIQFLPGDGVQVDIYDLRRLAEAEQWVDAAEFIHGDFLEGIYLDDNLEFETWLLGERERWRQEAERVLIEAAKSEQEQGHYSNARRHLARLLQLIPWHEGGHRQMMRLLAHESKFSAALQQYEQCRTILAEELDVIPSNETTYLNECIRVAMTMSPHNLPPQATPFIGREEEVTALKRRLANPDCCLLTLIGMGGIGKTRLALEVARQVAAEDFRLFLHGVAFVPLAGVDGQDLLTAVGAGLGIVFSGQQPARNQLITYLSDMEILIFVDNYEHLLPDTSLLSAILQEAPKVKLLVTSRERLNLQEEWLYDVEGLPYPEQEANEFDEVDTLDFAAVHMFKDCAERANRAGSLAAARREVAAICSLVQGMPLALELSAARLRSLTPADVLSELERGLDILTAETRNYSPRHASLRAAFDASWSGLSVPEQKVLSQLSLFRGGFIRGAAEKVAGATLSILSSLTDKSLIRLATFGRFEMHELLRQYANEKLAEDPAIEAAAHEQFAVYYGTFLKEREQRLLETDQKKTLKELILEMDNIRPAWRWLVEKKKVEILDETLWTLAFCLVIRGDVVQGLKLVETTLTHFTKPETSGEQQERLHARLRMFQGTFLFYAGRLVEVSDLLANVLDRLRRVGSVQDIGWNLVILSNAMVGPEGNVYIEEGLATVRSSGPRWLEGFISGRLADRLRWYDKRYSSEKYEQFALHAVSIGQQLNNPWILCDALLTDGILAIDQGMYHRAEKTCLQALMVAGQIDSLWMRGRALAHLSRISYGQGRFARAKQYIFESDLCFRRMGAMSWVAALFSFLGEIARVEGELDQAVSHYEAFLAQREELGLNSNLPIVSSLGHVFLRQLRLEQASNCFQKILVDAEWEDTFLFGMSFAGMAGVLVSTRRPNLAARLAGVAAASFTAFQYPLELADQQDWDRILAEIKESLDEETFTAAWNEGQQMSLEQAIAYALEVVN